MWWNIHCAPYNRHIGFESGILGVGWGERIRGCCGWESWYRNAERCKAYRIADTDEIVDVNDPRRARRSDDWLNDLGDLALGWARHDGGWLMDSWYW